MQCSWWTGSGGGRASLCELRQADGQQGKKTVPTLERAITSRTDDIWRAFYASRLSWFNQNGFPHAATMMDASRGRHCPPLVVGVCGRFSGIDGCGFVAQTPPDAAGPAGHGPPCVASQRGRRWPRRGTHLTSVPCSQKFFVNTVVYHGIANRISRGECMRLCLSVLLTDVGEPFYISRMESSSSSPAQDECTAHGACFAQGTSGYCTDTSPEAERSGHRCVTGGFNGWGPESAYNNLQCKLM